MITLSEFLSEMATLWLILLAFGLGSVADLIKKKLARQKPKRESNTNYIIQEEN